MVIITSHAVDRYIERSGKDIEIQEAFSILKDAIKRNGKGIQKALEILPECRLEIDGNIVGIIVVRNNKPKMVTCRKKKEVVFG